MKKEQSPHVSLTKIQADIAHVDRQAKAVEAAHERHVEKVKKLFEQASGILRESGETHQKNVGSGAGGNMIGFRIETENYFKTPPVAVKFEDKKAELALAEDFTSHSGYHVVKDKIVLTQKLDIKSGEERIIFLISKDGKSQNWLGKPATLRQMDMIGGILSFMKDSLSKIHVPSGINNTAVERLMLEEAKKRLMLEEAKKRMPWAKEIRIG